MTMQLEPIPMEIDCVEPPSPGSDESQISFTNDYESLPSSGPPKHAHIIDLAGYDECAELGGTISLQDAIVTTLFNVSPETLCSFLSPTVHTFKAIFKGNKQLVIWRKGLEVFIGLFEHHQSLKVYGFEHIAGLLIGYDGSWHLKVTAGDAYSNPKWPDVWAGKFESYGGISKMVVELDEVGMERRASVMGESILRGRYWGCKKDIKST
ncbi:hypothetical protein P153DRAFT_331643 [Dothidotthia symphoricarpi CBS 119687]|uniref:Uncharacterized protein n=1 Tax=Dothidotthia symphoricarpi CBS 119687 TaxID=1392245 RepID=A0A6A6AMG3_9PLEO|nr:uncharacterized protein P153DRAFT_331643 [Dothidotthia symphoricarpi CBS 119687]KAF2133172.1 hypothetical protein P153DRAFT_331643 [Dothidotthia symphoricarpi CBS 119687]